MEKFKEAMEERLKEEAEKEYLKEDRKAFLVFNSATLLLESLMSPEVSSIPAQEAAKLMEEAFRNQKKWSPQEVKPKWDLALAVLREEAVTLHFKL